MERLTQIVNSRADDGSSSRARLMAADMITPTGDDQGLPDNTKGCARQPTGYNWEASREGKTIDAEPRRAIS